MATKKSMRVSDEDRQLMEKRTAARLATRAAAREERASQLAENMAMIATDDIHERIRLVREKLRSKYGLGGVERAAEAMRDFGRVASSIDWEKAKKMVANQAKTRDPWKEYEFNVDPTPHVLDFPSTGVTTYKGEWYVGPVPEQYTGAIPADYTGRYRRIALDDEQKRIYCYEEDGFGNLNRKFVAQTDSKIIAEWIVAARNGRLVGKDNNDALANMNRYAQDLKIQIVESHMRIERLDVQIAQAKATEAMLRKDNQSLRDERDAAAGIAKVRELDAAQARAKLKVAEEELNARREARMSEIKDTGTRKLRLRAKE